MTILDRYLFKKFLPLFFGGLALFVLLLQLIDIFGNLWRYLGNNASIIDIARVSLLYLPKCISFSLPIALIFAIAYALGEMSAYNELIVIFSSGISLWRIALPFVVLGLILSMASFLFEDRVVIQTLYDKEALSAELTRQEQKLRQNDIIVKTNAGRRVYSVGYINLKEQTVSRVIVIDRNDEGNFLFMLKSPRGTWNGQYWDFQNTHCYSWKEGRLVESDAGDLSRYNEPPPTFVRNAKEVEQLPASQAKLFIGDLRVSGVKIHAALSDYYRRFAFSTTPLVVIILSMSMGGRFRKNILLMSLLSSLMAAVLYYVIQMVTMMLAKLGYIPPIVGAWFPAVFFIILAFAMIQKART